MDTALIVALVILIFFIYLFTQINRRKKSIPSDLPGNYRDILKEYVDFYNKLEPTAKSEFESRLMQFLSSVKITGVNTDVEDVDRVMIAASALIPIFAFAGWEYVNLHEVLLYPDYFNRDFDQKGGDRDILGMVGSGAMQHVMILSRADLREGFTNKTGKGNVAIHEFVHLIDKTDGSVDGIPEFILSKQYIIPWLQLMQQEMKNILENRSDINPYGITSQAEFFAVASEYFFERPDLLEAKHPELYELLSTIFRRKKS